MNMWQVESYSWQELKVSGFVSPDWEWIVSDMDEGIIRLATALDKDDMIGFTRCFVTDIKQGREAVNKELLPLSFYDGNLDVSSEYGNYSTDKCFGYSLFGILGMELNEWEALFGFRWSKVEFSDLKSGASNYTFSGRNFMFGLGWGF